MLNVINAGDIEISAEIHFPDCLRENGDIFVDDNVAADVYF